MEHVAFRLTDEHAGTVQPVDAKGKPHGDPIPHFQGGVLALPPDGASYDVAAKLAEGDGVIVVSTANVSLVELLRAYPALVETEVPEGWDDAAELDDKSVPELRDQAEALGLARSGNKPDLIERIRAHQAEAADAPDPDDDLVVVQGTDPAATTIADPDTTLED